MPLKALSVVLLISSCAAAPFVAAGAASLVPPVGTDRSDARAKRMAEEDAKTDALDAENRAAQDALLRRAAEQDAAQTKEKAEEMQRWEEASRAGIGNAKPIDPPPESPPPPPPPPRKLTEAERRRIAERRAAKEQRDREMAAAAVEALARFCGPAPERSKWDGIYIGLEHAYRAVTHDPDSIEFVSCSDATLRGAACWVFTCDVRGKNMLGAKILSEVKFRRTAEGWYLR